MPDCSVPTLTDLEARVVGVLVEKERTVSDTYPLTLNALLAGCNQKTSREPVMSATAGEVQAALDGLRRSSWVIESSGGRVMRYAHNARRVLGIPAESLALIATLMLRGPQTAGELRINSERLYRFADIAAIEAFLDELSARPAGALVVELPRQPGARETRWMHLLTEAGRRAPQAGAAQRREAQAGEAQPAALPGGQAGEIAALAARVARLEEKLAVLQSMLASVHGLASGGDGDDDGRACDEVR